MEVTAEMVLENGDLPAFTSLGGYTLVYYSQDFSTTFCAKCATKARTEDYKINALHVDVYYEGPVMQCDECNASIESAYGDPEECEKCHTVELKVCLRLDGEARGKRLCLPCYRVFVPEEEST